MLNRDRADLPKQTELIPTVPAFNELVAGEPDHYHSGDVDTMPGWGDAKALAGMSSFKDNADDGFVSLHNRVFYSNFNVGQSRPHVPPEDLN